MQIVLAGKNNVEPQYVEMMVPLYSYGCERKINKALSHIKGKLIQHYCILCIGRKFSSKIHELTFNDLKV